MLITGGILSQGLRIAPPEAPVSGYAFGKGIYLVRLSHESSCVLHIFYSQIYQADMSTKSANYCASRASGNIALLLLCEAELGRPPLKLTTGDYNAAELAKKANCISTWGVGQTVPAGWKDAGCVHPSLQGVQMPDVKQEQGASNEMSPYLLCKQALSQEIYPD